MVSRANSRRYTKVYNIYARAKKYTHNTYMYEYVLGQTSRKLDFLLRSSAAFATATTGHKIPRDTSRVKTYYVVKKLSWSFRTRRYPAAITACLS